MFSSELIFVIRRDFLDGSLRAMYWVNSYSLYIYRSSRLFYGDTVWITSFGLLRLFLFLSFVVGYSVLAVRIMFLIRVPWDDIRYFKRK